MLQWYNKTMLRESFCQARGTYGSCMVNVVRSQGVQEIWWTFMLRQVGLVLLTLTRKSIWLWSTPHWHPSTFSLHPHHCSSLHPRYRLLSPHTPPRHCTVRMEFLHTQSPQSPQPPRSPPPAHSAHSPPKSLRSTALFLQTLLPRPSDQLPKEASPPVRTTSHLRRYQSRPRCLLG